MDFFVSWYNGDACYPSYDDTCSLLVSVTSVPFDWTIRNLPQLPRKLLIDSGAFHLITAPYISPKLLADNGIPKAIHSRDIQEVNNQHIEEKILQLSPKKVLDRQLAILGTERIPTIVCALDYPILNPNLSTQEKDRCITQTIAFAWEFKHLLEERKVSNYITPMAIIQGYDIDTLKWCAHELAAMDFPLYGLGSLAPLKRHDPIMERVRAVASIISPERLHIFGVSAVQTILALKAMGIHSFDSARPAKAAAYNEVLYSHPFRRFGILETNDIDPNRSKGRIPQARRLAEPLLCQCPICLDNPESILIVGKRANIKARGVHNYYHLKQTLYDIPGC